MYGVIGQPRRQHIGHAVCQRNIAIEFAVKLRLVIILKLAKTPLVHKFFVLLELSQHIIVFIPCLLYTSDAADE